MQLNDWLVFYLVSFELLSFLGFQTAQFPVRRQLQVATFVENSIMQRGSVAVCAGRVR
jgi:hypothetical protein